MAKRYPPYINQADPEEVALWDAYARELEATQGDTVDAIVDEMEQATKHHVGERPVRWWQNYLMTRAHKPVQRGGRLRDWKD